MVLENWAIWNNIFRELLLTVTTPKEYSIFNTG